MNDFKPDKYSTPQANMDNKAVQPRIAGVFTIPIFVFGVVYVVGVTIGAAAVGIHAYLAAHAKPK